MVGLIYGGHILRVSLPLEKKRIASIIPFPIIIASLVGAAMWVQGYFIFNLIHVSEFGFGKFSMNILAPINPQPFSSFFFFKPLPMSTAGQYQVFGYWGLGLILLTVIAVIELIRHREFLTSTSTVPLIVICLVCIVLAWSNRIFLGNHEIFHISIPYAVHLKLGIIRVSGRMFYPVTYILMLACLVLVAKFESKRTAAIIILLALIVQLMDFYPFYRSISLDSFSWKTPLHSKLWAQFAKKYNHIACIPAQAYRDNYVPFALYAGDNGMTINVANLARADYYSKKQYQDEQYNQYAQGHFQSNTLYVFYDKSTVSDFVKSDSLIKHMVCIVDGYPVIAP
jgi:hypothetical protein